MIWYGCQTWDLSREQNMKRVQVCWNIAARKLWSVPNTAVHTTQFIAAFNADCGHIGIVSLYVDVPNCMILC